MEQPLLFHNKDFEWAVRDVLYIYNKPIYKADTAKVKKLCCADFSFSLEDYETLHTFKYLEELIFEQHNGIVDFSVFSPLKSLKYLTIAGGLYQHIELINIGALKKLPRLEYLAVGDFEKIDLADLGEVKQLKELCIGWGNSVINAEEIKELKQLTALTLCDFKIKSLDFLNELSVGISLEIGGLEIEEGFDVASLKRFQDCKWEMLSINGMIEEGVCKENRAQLSDTNPYRIHLAEMLHCFEQYITIPEEDIVLILMHLNTVNRVIRFMEWIQSKIQGDTLNTTAQEICRAAIWIHQGRTELP